MAFAVNAAREEASRRVCLQKRAEQCLMVPGCVYNHVQLKRVFGGDSVDRLRVGSGNEAWAIPPSRSESFRSVLTAAETGATKTQTRNRTS